jgi:hypothetical protein
LRYNILAVAPVLAEQYRSAGFQPASEGKLKACATTSSQPRQFLQSNIVAQASSLQAKASWKLALQHLRGRASSCRAIL